jgi:hypothetical protein
MAVVHRDTHDEWYEASIHNGDNDEQELYQLCPKHLAQFFEIPAEVIRVWNMEMGIAETATIIEPEYDAVEGLRNRKFNWRKYVKANQERYKLWSDY